MSTHHLKITPRDLLFMRDARPMEASDAGQGANWPRPDQLWNAIMAAFWRQWPERDHSFEGEKHTVNERDKHKDNQFRFGALLTAGPFPYKKTDDGQSKCYFPCPLDLGIQNNELLSMKLEPTKIGTNLPTPLKYLFVSPILGKDSPPSWIDAETYQNYLKNDKMRIKEKKPKLYDADRNIGITIEPGRYATVDGGLYQAEYLRLAENVSLAAFASCDLKAKAIDGMQDILAKFLDGNQKMILGGQQGVVKIEEMEVFDLPSLPQCPVPENDDGPVFLRWTLLTPASFPKIAANSAKNVAPHHGGWLPTWVDSTTGEVKLPSAAQKVERQRGETREAWRKRCQGEPITGAHLVGARIGKPIYFSGWKIGDSADAAPKQTHAAVPAGSVYLFECENGKTARQLWQVLNATDKSGQIINRRSAFGEKGFGLGVCSIVPKKIFLNNQENN